MAALPETDRVRIWRGLMRYWSTLRHLVNLSKAKLRAAVDATDTWIDDNQAAYNSALPSAAQDDKESIDSVAMLEAFEKWMDEADPTWRHANLDSQEFWWAIWQTAWEVGNGER